MAEGSDCGGITEPEQSRKACSPDDAACEGFFGRLKNELFDSRDWLATTIEEFVAALDSYIFQRIAGRNRHVDSADQTYSSPLAAAAGTPM